MTLYGDGFYLDWLVIRTTRREYVGNNEPKYVVYGVGQWNGHIMDWRGCNFWEKKLSGGVKPFKTVEEAKQWIQSQIDNGTLYYRKEIEGGYWSGDEGNERDVEEVSLPLAESKLK